MLSRSVFARYLLVAIVSAFVAMAAAATAVTAHNDGFNERILNCIETRDANSDQCRAAYPPLVQYRPGHWIACWHAEQLLGGAG